MKVKVRTGISFLMGVTFYSILRLNRFAKFIFRDLLSITESNQLCFDLKGPSEGALRAFGANLLRFSILETA